LHKELLTIEAGKGIEEIPKIMMETKEAFRQKMLALVLKVSKVEEEEEKEEQHHIVSGKNLVFVLLN
jgi:hypothetical protein